MSKGVKAGMNSGTKIRRSSGIQCIVLMCALIMEIVFAQGQDAGGYISHQNMKGQSQEEESGESISEEREDYEPTEEKKAEEAEVISEPGAPEDTLEPAKIVWEEIMPEYQEREDENITLVYHRGNLKEPVQLLKGKVLWCEDINFDGYPDIKMYNKEKKESSYFLWDLSQNQFVEAVMPEMSVFFFDYKLDEFKTIWNDGISWDHNREVLKMTEDLYRWEGNVLKKFRSISSRVGEDEVFVILTDTETGECLSSGTFLREGWEKNPEVRELYSQFYKGYAPEEFYYMRHNAPGEEEVIPDSLVKALSEAFLRGSQYKLLASLETGRKLSPDEMEEAGVKSADIAEILERNESNGYEYLEMIQADLDNDGREDIFSEVYFGGTGGFADYVLYRGNGEGIYQETGHGSGEFIWGYKVICWEGKNYVCRNERDYRKRELSGLVLEGYQDGELAEVVRLDLVPEKQEVSVRTCQDGYWKIAEKERQKAPEIYGQTEKGQVVLGDAEQKSEDTEEKTSYSCDMDNDGVTESYQKSIWTSSDLGTSLEFWMEKGAEEATQEAVYDRIRERPWAVMLWVDAYNGENIVNIIYRTGLYDYVIDGCLLEEDGSYSILYTIEGTTELAIEEVRTWAVPGKQWRAS